MQNSSHKLIIISSPSGAGKSTICKMLLERNGDMKLSISATTRKPRQSEIDGQHYFFIDQKEFAEMIENDQFLEYAKVFDNFYGTPNKMVEEEVAKGNMVLFDIDWQGARQIIKKFKKEQIISFFIIPPSIAELHKRLQNRAEDSEEVVLKRMQKAKDEMLHWDEYDYVIINKDLEESYQKITTLIQNPQNPTPDNKKSIQSFINQILEEQI